MDEFDKCGVKLALEVHPTEIAFDYWSTKKLLDVFEHRPTLGINFDPSHLIWQGLDPAVFILDLRPYLPCACKRCKTEFEWTKWHSGIPYHIWRSEKRMELCIAGTWRR